ncbi:CGNR zinc finger domain-containing protein [Sphingomonas cavernae]|uniref:4-hydroxybenzoyl-CoA reductase n=1 Tax=Sphingomonas cavernae TaxID=2320861 RepID=A0A418WRC4_9SPHN|nr:ABATE domain-containing protein [Sphingomonas cavernae]RJF93771.1 4-hydroxybenzoyl-CoA reductase [Sphingomonas cavernae]
MSNAYGFEFIAGSVSLSFVDTKGGRGGVAIERLDGPDALAAWLLLAGLATPDAARPGIDHVARAQTLREAIYRTVRVAMTTDTPSSADIATINRAAIQPPLRPQLGVLGVQYVAPAPVDAALSVIAADAIAVLGQAERLRECSECRMLFLDTSRPGRRRWCSSSAGCGNRAKVRNHRARARTSVGG